MVRRRKEQLAGRVLVGLAALSLPFAGCSGGDSATDLGKVGDGKSDTLAQLEIAPGASETFTFKADGQFAARIVQSEKDLKRRTVATIEVDGIHASAASTEPVLAVDSGASASSEYEMVVTNVGDETLRGSISVEAELDPSLQVRFTEPQCPAYPAQGVPAGAHCSGDNSEKSESRKVAGIVDNLQLWINDARRFKEANPDRDVVITMGYLTWNDYRIYDEICKATASGVKLRGFFDRQSGGSQPPKIASDPECNPSNISIEYLGGVTNYPDWRLMHIKMIIIDTGEPVTRIVFGSANMSSYGTSIHFENWVFSEFPSDSHFVQSHHCAVEGLMADRYDSSGNYPAVFTDTYDECVANISAEADPNYKVFFSPDSSRRAVYSIMDEMQAASSTVEMAIQHFSYPPLAQQLARNGGDANVATRLIVDDDTYYKEGETGGVDTEIYNDYLKGSGIDIHFMQTNGHLEYGKQYQHNKYIIVDGEQVFCGAGNFTSVAFAENYENFYLIKDPEFAAQYTAHFNKNFEIAAPAEDLPDSPYY